MLGLAVVRDVHVYVKETELSRGREVGGRQVRGRENRAWNSWTPKDSSERASGQRKNREGERERDMDG